ncbi:MAG: hypothetical protein ACOX1S_03555 [Anaerostipes sp.]|jgi:hypothetical protein
MKKKIRKKKVLSSILAISLCISLLPTTVFAEGYDTWGNVENVNVNKGEEIFYDIYGGAKTNRKTESTHLFQNSLDSNNSKTKTGVYLNGTYRPLYQMWDEISAGLYYNCETSAGSKNLGEWLSQTLGTYDDTTKNNNTLVYRDSSGVHWADNEDDKFDTNKAILKSGLQGATNRSQLINGIVGDDSNYSNASSAGSSIERQFEYTTKHNHSSSDYSDKLENKLKDAGVPETGPFFYSVNTVVAEHGNNGLDSNQGLSWGAVFYDFKLSYLETGKKFNTPIDSIPLGENEELYDYIQNNGSVPGISYTIDVKGGDKEFSVGAKNSNSKSASLTSTYGTSVSEEASQTRVHTEEYTLGESLEAEYKVGAKILGGELSLSVGFNATQMWSDTWQNSETYSNSLETSSSAKVELPAHTQQLLSTSQSETGFSLDYDYPVAVTYKVALFGNYFRHDTEGKIVDKGTAVLATFGEVGDGDSNMFALGNLKNRYANKNSSIYDQINGNSLNWNDILNNSFCNSAYENSDGHKEGFSHYNMENRIKALLKYQPYSVTGATLNTKVKSTNTEIYELQPLYQLKEIKTDSAYDYNMTVGDTFYINNIPLVGLNSAGVEYYGFDQNKGHWKLVDDNGDELSSSTSVASLEKDKVTGNTSLKATGKGTVYLKYFIDDDANYVSDQSKTIPASNNTVKRPGIKVIVNKDPFKGKIISSGTLKGVVGDAPVPVENSIKTKVYDENDFQINSPVTWKAQDLDGISIQDNQISFTKPGTYKIKACIDTQASDWVEVTALEERKLEKITLPTTMNLDLSNQKSVDLATLSGIQWKDQYESDWTKNKASDLTWHYKEKRGKEQTLSGSDFVLPRMGTFEVWATLGNLKSSTMKLVAKDSKHVNHDYKWIIDKAATAFEEGSKHEECSVCQEEKAGVKIPKLSGTTVKIPSDTYQSATLSWSAIKGASGYNIYQATSSNGQYKKVKTTTATTWKNTGLKTGKKYYYKVLGYQKNNGGTKYSQWSNTAGVKLKLPAPDFKLHPKKGTIKVTWKKVAGASGYVIYRAKSKGGTYKKLKTAKGNKRAYTSIWLNKKKKYYKMRSYRTVDGKRVYSSYTKVKTMKPN